MGLGSRHDEREIMNHRDRYADPETFGNLSAYAQTTYTGLALHILRNDGFGQFAGYLWDLRKFGVIKPGQWLFGVGALIGVTVRVWDWSLSGIIPVLVAGLGAYLMGSVDMRFCPGSCDCPCDHPAWMYGGDFEMYEDEELSADAITPDVTVER
jgi:hypothetical protein